MTHLHLGSQASFTSILSGFTPLHDIPLTGYTGAALAAASASWSARLAAAADAYTAHLADMQHWATRVRDTDAALGGEL